MVNQALFPEQVKVKAESVHYAKRLETRVVRERDFPYTSDFHFPDPASVVTFAKSLQDSDVEKILVLYLNTKNRLQCIQIVRGGIDRAILFPREIIKHAILSNSNSLILVHNHPSEDLQQSQEDICITKAVKNAAALFDIRITDHIIIGAEGRYLSFVEQGIMP